jgi:O-antigen ligase
MTLSGALRDPALAAALLLVGLALFFGGGGGDGAVWWLGGGAAVAIVVALATQGLPRGLLALLPFALLVAWLGLSISWSWLPDRSWNYADRGLVYLLFALLGTWLAGRTRELALGLCVLLGAVAVWALATKVFPPLYDYGPPGPTRLRAPIGLWNQLALLADIALPLALWRRRVSGTLLAYAWLVALVLTYSRGGLATAVLVVTTYLVLADDRLERGATLVAAALPAAAVAGIAFALPGVTKDGQSTATRWRDGLVFGVLLLAGAGAAVLLARAPRPRDTPALRRALLVAGSLALVAVVAVAALKAGSFGNATQVGNSGGRFGSTSSNFRTVWWGQALDAWRGQKLAGTGAGTFQLANLRYRDSYLDVTIEPHSLPLQFLSETGIVGLILLVATAAALLRGSLRRRGHELALALVLPAYLVHSLIDIDWDFIAVSAPVFLAAGALTGRLPFRRVSPFAVVASAGAVLLAIGILVLPWLGSRWALEAQGAPPARAITLAKRAESVDPLLVEPLWARAFAAEEQGNPRLAFAEYVRAVRRQPKNPATWQLAGLYAFAQRCYQTAYTYLEKYTELDNKARPSAGGAQYNEALRRVNAGKGRC